jgi:hypothetical protein
MMVAGRLHLVPFARQVMRNRHGKSSIVFTGYSSTAIYSVAQLPGAVVQYDRNSFGLYALRIHFAALA